MSFQARAGVSWRTRSSLRLAAMLSFVRARLDAAQCEISLDLEDLLYAEGFAAGERGMAWPPAELSVAERQVWTEGYRDGRHGGSGTGRRSLRGLAAASLA